MALIESFTKELVSVPGQPALRGQRVELKQQSSLKFISLLFNIFFTLMSSETRGILSDSVFSITRTGFNWIYMIMNFYMIMNLEDGAECMQTSYTP